MGRGPLARRLARALRRLRDRPRPATAPGGRAGQVKRGKLGGSGVRREASLLVSFSISDETRGANRTLTQDARPRTNPKATLHVALQNYPSTGLSFLARPTRRGRRGRRRGVGLGSPAAARAGRRARAALRPRRSAAGRRTGRGM